MKALACGNPLSATLGVALLVALAGGSSDGASALHNAPNSDWNAPSERVNQAPPTPSPAVYGVVVRLRGGGRVVSIPPGIDCPSDCFHTFSRGQRVELHARATAGFRFRGWNGACAGRGGCQVDASLSEVLAATFAPVRRQGRVPTVSGDRDRDGVPDRIDPCRGSERGHERLENGCTRAQLIQEASSSLIGVRRTLEVARAQLSGLSSLRTHGRQLEAVERALRSGASTSANGLPCEAAASITRAASSLAQIDRRVTATVARLQRSIDRGGSGDRGDADARDVYFHQLTYRRDLTAQALVAVRGAAHSFSAGCRGLGRRAVISGIVAATDDAAGTLTLRDGPTVLVPRSLTQTSVYEGARIRIVTQRLDKGLELASKVELAGDVDTVMPTPQPEGSCIRLHVAPVQNFFKPRSQLVTHRPAGYTREGIVWLEHGARFAAAVGCSPLNTAPYRYSLRITFLQGAGSWTLAPDLTPNDAPVDIPSTIGNDVPATLRVTVRAVRCPKVGRCGATDVTTTGYKLRVLARGAYATAEYDNEAFDLEDDDTTGFRVAQLKPLTDRHPVLAATSVDTIGFEAEGFLITPNGASTRPEVKLIPQSAKFAIYKDDFVTEEILLPETVFGVDHPAGLTWPRVRGTRAGNPFQYAVTLPEIVRDLVSDCGSESCFYRLPWSAGDVHDVTQGNNNACAGCHAPGTAQSFAFDFGMPLLTPIVATRGGRVGFVEEAMDESCFPSWCAANALRIDHEDGTHSWYLHMIENGVLVEEGQRVDRGDAVGIVGNTGRSTGAHLHYQVSDVTPANDEFDQTIPILFEGLLIIPGGLFGSVAVPLTCFAPGEGISLESTNS